MVALFGLVAQDQSLYFGVIRCATIGEWTLDGAHRCRPADNIT